MWEKRLGKVRSKKRKRNEHHTFKWDILVKLTILYETCTSKFKQQSFLKKKKKKSLNNKLK